MELELVRTVDGSSVQFQMYILDQGVKLVSTVIEVVSGV